MKRFVILLSFFLLVGCENGEKKKENGEGIEKGEKKTGQEIRQKYESKEVTKKKQNLVIEKIKEKLLPTVSESYKEILNDNIKSYVKGWSFHIIKNKIIVNKLNSYFVGKQWRCVWKGYFNNDRRIDYFVVARDKKYFRAITKGIILGAKGEHILEINLERGFFNKKGDILNLSQIGIDKNEFRAIRLLPGNEQFENTGNHPIFMLNYAFIDDDGNIVYTEDVFISPSLIKSKGRYYYEIDSPDWPIKKMLSYISDRVKRYRQAKKEGKAKKAFNMSPYPKDYKDIANIK